MNYESVCELIFLASASYIRPTNGPTFGKLFYLVKHSRLWTGLWAFSFL